jgi:hypothetical protein
VWNEPKENSASIDILCEFSKESTEEEHHVVERIEPMPEGRDDEYCHAVEQSRFLSWHQSSIVDVVLQPNMDHMIPMLQL